MSDARGSRAKVKLTQAIADNEDSWLVELSFGRSIFMKGSLSQQLIADPLNAIHSNAQSGSLVVRRESVAKTLRFEQGFLVDAESNDPSEAFGEMLLRMGRLSPDQLDAAAKSGTSAEALSGTLVAMNLVKADQLAEFRSFHAKEIACSLFNWVSGSFEFKAESGPGCKTGLKLAMPGLIFEAVRRITNPEIIHRGLGGTDRVIRLVSDFETRAATVFLQTEEAFVLSRIESSARVSEVLQISPLGLEMTQKTLYGFLATGIAELVQANASKRDAPIPAASRAYRSSSAPTYQAEPVRKAGEAETVDAEDMESVQTDVALMLETAKTKNYYDLLGVATTAQADEIKKAYYSLAKKYHPDRYHQSESADLKSALEVIFSTLAQAYDTLKVPATRGSYDAKVFRLESPSGGSSDKSGTAAPTSAPQQKLAELNYRQGRGQYDQQDYWSAVQAFRQSVRMEPEVARYRYWLAMALSKNAKWRREAEEHFLKAIELEQFNADYYAGLGLLYKEAGMLKRAESQLKQALQLNPGNKAVLEALDNLLAASVKKGSGLDTLKGFFKKK
jgi:curved DNA-binding protein CbpA